MHQFEAAYANWIIRNRWIVIPVMILLVLIAAAGARHLYFVSDYRVYFGPDNPQRVAFEELENTYVKSDNVLIVIAPQDGNVFTRKNLAIVEDATSRSWQVPFSNRVDSLTNFQYTKAEEDDLIVADLVKNAAELSDDEIAIIQRIALDEPLLRRSLISDDSRVAGIFINVQLPGIDETGENEAVVAFVRNMEKELEAQYPVDVYLTGMVMMNNAFPEASLHDMANLIPLSFVIMVMLLAYLVGGVVGTLATVLVFGMSVMGALGLAGYLSFPITPVSAPSPTIILTVAVANCVHVLVSYIFGMRHGLSQFDALEESLRINLQPVCIASVTTAIGFLSLRFSEVPPFQQLGTIVAMGVLISFVLAVTLLPALIAVLPTRPPKARRDEEAMIRLGDFVVRHRRRLLWSMGLIIVLLVANVPRNELNDVYLHWFGDSIPFRNDTDFTIDNLTGLYTSEYSLRASESGGISEPAFLQQAENFANWIRNEPGVRHVRTYTDIAKRLNKNMHGDDESMYRLPDDRDLAAQYLLLYEMSLPYGLDLNNQINVDKSAMRITVTTDTLSTNEILALGERAQQWFKDNAPDVDALPASGTIIMFAHIGHRNIRAMLVGTTIALILISLILITALRSLKIGLVSLIPNLVPCAVGFGLWGIFVGEVGLSLSIVMSMTLGIVIDDTVHFLSKYLRARREQGLDAEDAVRYAFRTVGRALLVTSIILVVGFSVIAQSDFAGNADMGELTAVVIALALIADFLFLPPLLMKIEEKRNGMSSDTDAGRVSTHTA